MTLRNMSNSCLPGLPKKSKPTGRLFLLKDEVKRSLTLEEEKRLSGRDKYPIVIDVSTGYKLSSTDFLRRLPPNSIKE